MNDNSSTNGKQQTPRSSLTSKSRERGSGERTFVDHTYHDHLHDPVDLPNAISVNSIPASATSSSSAMKQQKKGPRGGVTVSFPEKLHQMLSVLRNEGLDDIVAWQPHGRCFLVRKKNEFVEDIMPRFFSQSKLTSFQRQLNLYGFIRLTSGNDRGAYYHELFLRSRPDLCRRMIRTRVKGNGMKAASSPSTEPDFFAMEPCPDEPEESMLQTGCPSVATSSNEQSKSDYSAHSGSVCSSNQQDQKDSSTCVSRLLADTCSSSAQDPLSLSLKRSYSLTAEDGSAVVSLPSTPYNDKEITAIQKKNTQSIQLPHLPSMELEEEQQHSTTCLPPPSAHKGHSLLFDTTSTTSNKITCSVAESGFFHSASASNVTLDGSCLDGEEPSKSTFSRVERKGFCDSIPKNGDEVFFEGLKFRYLDRLEMDMFQMDMRNMSYNCATYTSN